MPARSKHKSHAINLRALEDLQPVETNLRYWLIHALHWQALLLAIISVLVIGVTLFNEQTVYASAEVDAYQANFQN
jgi:hypothetical protein